jgi:hypothetical protein
MGLLDEIEIAAPEELKKYVKKEGEGLRAV